MRNRKLKSKRILPLFVAAAISAFSLEGARLHTQAAAKASVTLNKEQVSIEKGQKTTLRIVTKNVKKVISKQWSVKDKSVAAVNSKGTVTGRKAGSSTTVTCKVKYKASSQEKSQSKKLKCKVIVKKQAASALAPNIMAKNQIQQNPYLSSEESMIHNDIYNSDVTGKAMPLGIFPELVESAANDSPIAPPAFFYDNYGNAAAPYSQILSDGSVLSGGVAIRDMDSSDLKVLGKFQPPLDDNGAKYGIQISYSFVDKKNNLVGPTTHGHVVMLETYDSQGNIRPVFQKKLDVDIVSAAVSVLGGDIDKNILSVAYDYEGNLWFVTGGFHKNPAYSKAGFVGCLERDYIDLALAGGGVPDAAQYLHFQKLSDGENAENGIAAHPQGCVILTNQACYLFAADASGVQQKWRYAYESVGGKGASPENGITGAGLAWGGGSSPTLTNGLVLFTDNQNTVNLIALDVETGAQVTKFPVLDLGSDVIVSVENSISVYAPDDTRASVLVCNWYGAGNAGLFKEGADSSVQSYANIYDQNWTDKGSSCLMPGVERVDLVKQPDGSYQAQTIWTREDLKDTSMIKLSTAAGYYYGYTQDEKTSEWGFIALDYDTGKTAMWQPVSEKKEYNNMAVGIMQGNNGNSIYCPTNSKTLVRFQDRFAYLPKEPEKKLDLVKMERNVMSVKEFQRASGSRLSPASYLMSASIDDASGNQVLAFRVNGLSGSAGDYTLYYMDTAGKLNEYQEVVWADSTGDQLDSRQKLRSGDIYEVRIKAVDSGSLDCDSKKGTVKVMAILAADAGGSDAAAARTEEELYAMAVKDAAFAEADEIYPLVSLTKQDKLVTWDEDGRVLLCTWHSYPDSYPQGETVTAEWGHVWAFTGKELATHADELEQAKDSQMRLRQLLAISPGKTHSTVTGVWADPSDVVRPAYQSDASIGTMTTAFPEGGQVDAQFKSWFDQNILDSYFYGSYPWTRLGYTYDWADNGKTYGMTEFLIQQGAKLEVAFTETTDEFLSRLYGGNIQ